MEVVVVGGICGELVEVERGAEEVADELEHDDPKIVGAGGEFRGWGEEVEEGGVVGFFGKEA